MYRRKTNITGIIEEPCQCKQAMDFPDLQAKGFSRKVKFFNSLRSSQPARLHIELIVHIFPKLSFKTTETELHFKKMNIKDVSYFFGR